MLAHPMLSGSDTCAVILRDHTLLCAAHGLRAPEPDRAYRGQLQQRSLHCDCDTRDPALARGDRAAAQSSVWSRNITAHVSDPDNMGWASIDNGNPGDEVWLDRSFDGGQTWTPDGSKLGDTFIPTGDRGWRTLMYKRRRSSESANRRHSRMRQSGRPPRNRVHAVGALHLQRWQSHRRRRHRAHAVLRQRHWLVADHRMVECGQRSHGPNRLFERTGSSAYSYAIGVTFDANKGSNFTNSFLDDTGWWGLAWLRAFDLTGDTRYRAMAQIDADYMNSFRDGHCGGGVWWSTAKQYKNAIANELFISSPQDCTIG